MGNGPGWAFQVKPLIFKNRLLLNMSSLYSVTMMLPYKVVRRRLSEFPELGSAQRSTTVGRCLRCCVLGWISISVSQKFLVNGLLIRLACCDNAVSSKAEL
ncbi:hypothetical protein LEMLEM_LOCUS8794 [Lemmus lemmus]